MKVYLVKENGSVSALHSWHEFELTSETNRGAKLLVSEGIFSELAFERELIDFLSVGTQS